MAQHPTSPALPRLKMTHFTKEKFPSQAASSGAEKAVEYVANNQGYDIHWYGMGYCLQQRRLSVTVCQQRLLFVACVGATSTSGGAAIITASRMLPNFCCHHLKLLAIEKYD